jgi:solute carrier family 25 carnitine/acylcarnitine transporter 20/29
MTTCAKDLFAEQGFKGFVRGLSTPATLATPVTSLAFTGKTLARIVLFPGEIERKQYGQVSTCAAFGGLLATLVSCPGERIKCVLQVNSHIKRPRDALFFLTRTYGFAGLYKGWTFTALRDVPGYTAFFLSYRYLRYIYIIFSNLKNN